jgi:hypothetical protein
MTFLQKLLAALDGRKTIIVGVLVTTLAYIGAKGWLGSDDVTFIGAIITIIFGGASVATKALFTTEPNEIK